MKLLNYLKDLSEYNSVGDTMIRLNGINSIIKKLIDEIKSEKGYGSIKIIINNLNKHRRTIDNWRYNDSPPPISSVLNLLKLWKDICKKSQLELEYLTDMIFSKSSYFSIAKGKKILLPKEVTPKMAYLLGYTMGDGCLVDYLKRKRNVGCFKYEIKIASATEEFAGTLNKLFNDVFSIKGKIYKTKNKCLVLVIQSKVLYIFFNKILKMPIGKKKGKLKIPLIIRKASNEIKKNFIAGFFDADGCVYIKRKYISVSQADNNFLKELAEIFNGLGIKTRKIYKTEKELGITFSVSIRWCSVERFIDQIPILEKSKVKKINELRQQLALK